MLTPAALLLALAPLPPPLTTVSAQEPVPAEVEPEPTFPSLEPFAHSRFWRWTRPDVKRMGLRAAAESLESAHAERAATLRIMDHAAAAAGLTVPMPGRWSRAVFHPEPSQERGAWLQLVPVAMDLLRPLWEKAEWSEDDHEAARAIARFLASQPDAPPLAFGADAGANRAQLAALAAWFRESVRDPETYARMILTVDDGPWRAVRHRTRKILPGPGVRVDDQLEVRLHEDEGAPAPWILQGVRDGELAWSYRITEVFPDGALHFPDPPAVVSFPSYGWKIRLRFGRPGDIESLYLYLGVDGKPLFYFTSW